MAVKSTAKGKGKDDGPEWLQELHALDRIAAKRWLAAVGETRFMRIASTATAKKRPRHRPPVHYTPLLEEAFLLWLSDKSLDETDAAHLTARRVCATDAWKGCVPIGEASLRRRMRVHVQTKVQSLMTIGAIVEVAREASKLGLATRYDEPFHALSPAAHVAAWANIRPLATVSRPTSPPSLWTGLENRMKKLQPLMHLAAALEGHVDPRLPVSALANGLRDLIAALQEQAPPPE